MAFTLEDGTGVAGANSYVSVAEYRAHHADRGTDVTAQLDADIQGALVQSADYADKRYGNKYRGFREQKEQGLLWPRLSAFDDDGFFFSGTTAIPTQLKMAMHEYALIILQVGRGLTPTPTIAFATYDSSGNSVSGKGGEVKRTSETVGPIRETVSYNTSESSAFARSSALTPGQFLPSYPVADEWIAQITNVGSSTPMGRA